MAGGPQASAATAPMRREEFGTAIRLSRAVERPDAVKQLEAPSSPQRHRCNAGKSGCDHTRARVIDGKEVPFGGCGKDTATVGLGTHTHDASPQSIDDDFPMGTVVPAPQNSGVGPLLPAPCVRPPSG